jgi:hypothetical protein
MRKLMMMAGIAALAAAMPALAEAKPGNGQSARSGQHSGQAQARTRTRTEVRSNGRARTDARANTRAAARTGSAVDRRLDTDGDGIPDHRDRMTDRNRDGIDDRRQNVGERDRDGNRYGGNVCPPGLANRTPACVPPGQARRIFREGQVLPTSYRDYLGYQDLLGRLPESYRDDIPTGDYRYIYQNDAVYVVDARTRLVRNIIDILR